MSGQRKKNCNTSYRNRSVVVAENNRVAKSKCWQYTSSNKMWGNFSKVLILHISFTAVKINGGIGKGIGGIWNGKFQNVNIILLGAVWRAWRAWRKRKLKPWPPNNFPTLPQKMFPPCPKKIFFLQPDVVLMLLWFTDLMNVTEKVTIHRQTFRHSCLVPSSEVI